MSRESDRVVDEFERFIERAMGRLQLRVYQAITIGTPVLTGWARAHWIPGTGAAPTGPAVPPNVFAIAESQARAIFAQNQQVSARLAQGYRLSMGPVFIVNNTNYIGFLNAGTSAQAPAMFVEQAVQTGVEATQRELAA